MYSVYYSLQTKIPPESIRRPLHRDIELYPVYSRIEMGWGKYIQLLPVVPPRGLGNTSGKDDIAARPIGGGGRECGGHLHRRRKEICYT